MTDPSHRVIIFTHSASLVAKIKQALSRIDEDWEFFEVQAESNALLAMNTFPGSLMFTDHAPEGTLVVDFDPGFVLFIQPSSAEPHKSGAPWTMIDEIDLELENGRLHQLIINFWMHGYIDNPLGGTRHRRLCINAAREGQYLRKLPTIPPVT